MPNKIKLKVEDGETKNIKCEAYCYLCQTHGHILSEKCAVSAVCLDCGVKGHVRRDCKEERCALKSEIKSELKCEGSDSEEEYIEQEIPKDELNSDKESGSESEETTKDVKDIKKIKTEVYCILCQMYGHIFSEACVVNARCFECAAKGHVRKDCRGEKSELKNVKLEVKMEGTECQEEYVEMETDEDKLKTEVSLESTIEVATTRENSGSSHFMKKCTVRLSKVNIKQYEPVKFTCQKCSYKTKYKGELTRHMKVEHEGVRIRYACQKCSYVAKYKFRLTQHVQAEHNGVRYSCLKCSYKTKYKSDLTVHMKAEHYGVRYDCKECDFQTKHKASLANHMQAKHHSVGYPCKECEFKSKQKRHLTRHVQAEHHGFRYACKECEFTSKQKGHLTRHVQAEHKGVKYTCKKCSYETKRSDLLQKHTLSEHEGIRYSCQECNYKSKLKRSLTVHVQAKHEGIKYTYTNVAIPQNTKASV